MTAPWKQANLTDPYWIKRKKSHAWTGKELHFCYIQKHDGAYTAYPIISHQVVYSFSNLKLMLTLNSRLCLPCCNWASEHGRKSLLRLSNSTGTLIDYGQQERKSPVFNCGRHINFYVQFWDNRDQVWEPNNMQILVAFPDDSFGNCQPWQPTTEVLLFFASLFFAQKLKVGNFLTIWRVQLKSFINEKHTARHTPDKNNFNRSTDNV